MKAINPMTRRIYLDSAVLFDLADGKISSAQSTRLLQALQRSGAVVVLSSAHLLDFCGAELDTRERMLALLDALPCFAWLQTGTILLEEERIGAALRRQVPSEPAPPIDIALLPIPVLASQLLRSWRAGIVLRVLREISRGMHRANALGHRAISTTSTPVPRGSQRILSEHVAAIFDNNATFVTTLRALKNGRAEVRRAGMPIPPPNGLFERLIASEFGATLLISLMRKTSVLGRLQTAISEHGGDNTNLAKFLVRHAQRRPVSLGVVALPGGEGAWLALAPQIAPGLYLRTMLEQAKEGDRKRLPHPSDLADATHVEHVPYVDAATVDKDNHARMQQLLKAPRTIELRDARWPRAGVAFPNGRLDKLIELMEGWA